MSLIEQQKEICMLLVGAWCSEPDEVILIFDFSDNLDDKFPLKKHVKGQVPIESFYEINSHPDPGDANKFRFYLTIGYSDKNNFFIKKLTDNELVLRPMANGFETGDLEIKYMRKADIEFANDLLKNMGLAG